MTTVNAGDIFVTTFTIRDSTGNLYDPPVVQWHYRKPRSTAIVTKVYGTDAAATKVGTGVYQLQITIPYESDSVGNWDYNAQALDGSGNSLIVKTSDFYVAPDEII